MDPVKQITDATVASAVVAVFTLLYMTTVVAFTNRPLLTHRYHAALQQTWVPFTVTIWQVTLSAALWLVIEVGSSWMTNALILINTLLELWLFILLVVLTLPRHHYSWDQALRLVLTYAATVSLVILVMFVSGCGNWVQPLTVAVGVVADIGNPVVCAYVLAKRVTTYADRLQYEWLLVVLICHVVLLSGAVIAFDDHSTTLQYIGQLLFFNSVALFFYAVAIVVSFERHYDPTDVGWVVV